MGHVFGHCEDLHVHRHNQHQRVLVSQLYKMRDAGCILIHLDLDIHVRYSEHLPKLS